MLPRKIQKRKNFTTERVNFIFKLEDSNEEKKFENLEYIQLTGNLTREAEAKV